MMSTRLFSTIGAAALMETFVRAQSGTTDQNPSIDILSCSSLTCIDDTSGVCQSNATLEIGVGIAARVLSIPGSNDQISLTLVDGPPLGVLAGSGAWLTTQSLYAGIPASFNVSRNHDACALMLQYQAQTLMEDESLATNTTSCTSTIASNTQDVLTYMIKSFDYSLYGQGNNTALPRCEALTQHLNAEIRSSLSLGPWLSTFLTVAGGAIAGADANQTVATPQNQGCQPVSPQEYVLHPVASMKQFLYRSGPMLPSNDDGNEYAETGAGRTGVTPVITMVYGGDGDPDVQYICMKTFSADGGKLPQHRLSENETSGASPAVARGTRVLRIAALVGLMHLFV